MGIDTILDNIYPLPEGSKVLLKHLISEVEYPKGHMLLKKQKIESPVYFLKSGIARAYSVTDGHETTFWFGKEGDAVLSMRSYVHGMEGYEDIELLEASVLYKLQAQDLQHLYLNDVQIANWGRRFAEKELMKTEQRLISLQFLNAAERYKDLLEKSPELIQRVSLRHIASYLGITQVSLSRIRSEFR